MIEEPTIASTVELPGGVRMPRFGLGVFRAGAGDETRNAVRAALAAGYRHVDTARIYRNEREVGEAIRASGVPREQLFVTTKLWNDDHGYDAALRGFDASLADLGLDHIDLYLIHWPVPEKRLDSWRALERILGEKRARAIGVSNFTERHLDELIARATVRPAVNQFEIHPFLPQHALVAHCRKLGIVTEAYSPFAKGRKLDDPRLVALARELGRTPAQVCVRWSLQMGHVVIPKSSNPERIVENARVFDFELSPAQMQTVAALEDGYRSAWDPTTVA